MWGWEALVNVPGLQGVASTLKINKVAEIIGNSVLNANVVLELVVVLDHLVTSSLEVMDEGAPALLVIFTDSSSQKVGTVL